jgi:transposase
MSYVCGQSRDQCTLFPLALDELVGADHVCRVIEAFVRSLDLRALGFARAQCKTTGRPPYDPGDLLGLYLYGYLHRVRSSRRLERECQRNVEVMWLLNRLQPDHKTIAEFRRVNGPALKQAGAQFVRLCAQAGLVRGEWVAVDGSKFQAVASGKAVVDAEELDEQQQRLEQRLAQYLDEMDQADVQAQQPEPDAQAVRQALAKLAQQREQLAQAQSSGATRVVSTEPEAVVLKGKGPGYNVQTAVDAQHALIVAHEVNAQAGDNGCLQAMGEAAQRALGASGFNLVADAGYANGEQAQALENLGIAVHVPVKRAVNNQGDGALFDQARFSYDPQRDAYTCPADKLLRRKQLHRAHKVVVYAAQTSDCADCTLKAQCTRAARRLIERHLHEQAILRMQQRATPQAMRLRRCTVEHPFAALKYQILEKPRLLLRGLKGAATEMALATLAYNLKRALAVLGPQAMMGAIARA